jgi:hypothetical protein
MKGGLASAWQREVVAKGAVDEFGAGIRIKQHDADVDLVECGRKPRRGRVLGLLGSKGVDPFLPQHAGNDGSAAGRQCEQDHPRDVVSIVARRRAMIEEEQGGKHHRNGGTDQAGDDAADRTRQRDDADEQRRRIGHRHEMAVDGEGDQRHRCRQRRAENCAPVELHGHVASKSKLGHAV